MRQSARSTAATVRTRVAESGERFWTHKDFSAFSPFATQQALSRLTREGLLQRVRKGLYYHPRPTVFGTTVASSSDVAAFSVRTPVHPSGLLAANILGLTTQNPLRPEFAAVGHNAPPVLEGNRVHTERPAARAQLSREEGAFLEILRQRGRFSDLDPEGTRAQLLRFLREPGRFARLAEAALEEPPRVRAMLGALGEDLGGDGRQLARLRESLNPLSRFDFGLLRSLPNAERWQSE